MPLQIAGVVFFMGVIGQKELVKTAVVIEISMAAAVISSLETVF